MSDIVFDSSAVLAILQDEPGGDTVAQYLGRAVISAVNLQEVAKELVRGGRSAEDVRAILGGIDMKVVAHDAGAAFLAAALYPQTRRHGRGLGDRTCMALGLQLGLPVLTADREWKQVKIDGLELRHLR